MSIKNDEPTHDGDEDKENTIIIDGPKKIINYRMLWKKIARKALDLSLKDPWLKYKIHEEKTCKCIRYTYNASYKTWKKDEVYVKKQKKSFARGAMRECFRLKKMEYDCSETNWKLAMNYVCKRYIQEVDRNIYFEDVKLQMDSKLWAEEFNRHNPPKKIDIFQMSILEFIEEEDAPLYHLEHYIEGEYIKHNSNSGFVSEINRMTPHAFSHFTFERSGHQLIIVDIQGVDDLYTDPQIHTAFGTDYGGGNLGTKGMALFFHSHQCNDICRMMRLTEFDLSPKELISRSRRSSFYMSNPSTKFSTHAQMSLDPCESIVTSRENAMERLRLRTISMNSLHSLESIKDEEHPEECVCEHCLEKEDLHIISKNLQETFIKEDEIERRTSSVYSINDGDNISNGGITRRKRYYSGYSDSLQSEASRFQSAVRKMSKPAGFMLNASDNNSMLNSLKNSNSLFVLGQVHLDLARYYSIGKFSRQFNVNNSKSWDSCIRNELSNEELIYDKESALFHLDISRKCGVLEAIKTIAEMAYDLPHDLMKDIQSGDLKKYNITDTDDVISFGFKLMELAAEMSDRDAIHFIASAYETGTNLPNGKHTDWSKAMYWYEKALEYYALDEIKDHNDENGSNKQDLAFVCPQYEILAKMGQMSNEGGYGLERDSVEAYNFYNDAAEAAMEAMKGKLANKYYELAEMCYCDDK